MRYIWMMAGMLGLTKEWLADAKARAEEKLAGGKKEPTAAEAKKAAKKALRPGHTKAAAAAAAAAPRIKLGAGAGAQHRGKASLKKAGLTGRAQQRALAASSSVQGVAKKKARKSPKKSPAPPAKRQDTGETKHTKKAKGSAVAKGDRVEVSTAHCAHCAHCAAERSRG
eukprot:COSAG01_NODE_10189_length_2226_cov_1.173484_3_plen_168_part_01